MYIYLYRRGKLEKTNLAEEADRGDRKWKGVTIPNDKKDRENVDRLIPYSKRVFTRMSLSSFD